MTNVAVWLSCYAYIFAILSYLTTTNQCLTIFFAKECVSLVSIDEKNFQKFGLTRELVSI